MYSSIGCRYPVEVERVMARLRKIGGSACGNGPCPSVYETDNGTIVVQGFAVSSAEAGIEFPPGEAAVELPRDVLERVFGRPST